jgi:hypothetical protein
MAGLVTSQMSKDWNDYWGNTKTGDTQAWGNGALFRNVDGSATYRSKNGVDTNFNAGMSIEDFAKSNSEVGNILYNNYGYKAGDAAAVQPVMPTITTPSVTSATAATRTVGDNELVSSQLQKLLATDSPYLQQARNKAAQTANSRGLLNSAMAAGWGESAAIDAAAPIAQADAGAYTSAARDNQSAQNTVSLNNASAANQAEMARAAAANQASMAAANMQMQDRLNDKQTSNQYQTQQEQNKFAAAQQDKQNAFTAAQQDKNQGFQLEQLKQNMNLAYDKMTVDQTNAYASGYLNIVNSNMPQADKELALSSYSSIYGFHDNLATGTSVDLSVLPAAQSTVNSYWASGKAGDAGAWGGGQIVNNGNGSAIYTTKDGRTVALNSGMSLADLAATDSEVAANLKSLYGYGG